MVIRLQVGNTCRHSHHLVGSQNKQTLTITSYTAHSISIKSPGTAIRTVIICMPFCRAPFSGALLHILVFDTQKLSYTYLLSLAENCNRNPWYTHYYVVKQLPVAMSNNSKSEKKQVYAHTRMQSHYTQSSVYMLHACTCTCIYMYNYIYVHT